MVQELKRGKRGTARYFFARRRSLSRKDGYRCRLPIRFCGKAHRQTESYPEEGWNENGNCGVVAGAGDFDWYAIDVIRSFVGGMPMLIPGIGAQGGDLGRAVTQAMHRDSKGGETNLPAIINSSRGILYASGDKDFAEASREAAVSLSDSILEILDNERAK